MGGLTGDQVLFWIGRHWGEPLLARMPRAAMRVLHVQELLRKHDALLIVGIRFMYGLRIVGPIAIGASGVAPARFLRFNLIGAAIWAPLIAGAGYLFGQALSAVLESFGRLEQIGLLVVAVLVLAFVLMRRRRARRRA